MSVKTEDNLRDMIYLCTLLFVLPFRRGFGFEPESRQNPEPILEGSRNITELIYRNLPQYMWRNIRRYHFFYHRKGFYKFLSGVSLKFAAIMGLVLLGLALFEHLTPGIAFYFAKYTVALSNELIIGFFFLSETLLGLVPPDLFILWAKQFTSPYAVVALLAVLSYGAGLLAYFLGMRLGGLKKLHDYIHGRFGHQFALLRSWGGFIIVLAALLPLPYSTMCLGAGLLKYSFRMLLILGMFRIVRFFVYAGVLYQVV